MPIGYMEQILEIDLCEKKFQIQDFPYHYALKFLGGSGLSAWMLYNEVKNKPGIDPLSPDNPLIFGAGPLVGVPFPTAARCSFTSLSPLTGIFGDSNGGGISGVAVKQSGFDHLIIRGISDKPCYLVLGADEKCRIEDATDLWGKNTDETEKKLKEKYPKAVVFAIGPAGENLVRYAAITSNNNITIFGRSGMGAVMGSKKLKAIVALGGKKVGAANAEALKNISDKILKGVKEFPRAKLFHRYGTPMFLNIMEAKGLMYGENWRRKINNEDVTPLDIGAYYDAAESKAHGCFRCPLTCGKKWKIKDGPHKGEAGHGFEVSHIFSFGLTLGVRDVSTILHLIKKMNLMGLDINEFCGAAGMAIDAYKHGILSKEMADGLSLDWGKEEIISKLIDKVANREGIGDILAEGTKKAAKKIGKGAEDYALHMKGMHWPAHSAPAFAMAFSLSTRGGDFLKGVPHLLLQNNIGEVIKKLFGGTKKSNNIYSHDDKGRAVWWHENYKLATDSLGFCFYLSMMLLPYGRLFPDELADSYSALTGMVIDGKDIMTAGERGYQVERAINSFRGMNRTHDSFTRRPEPDSWGKGIDLNAKGMIDEYYAYRGLSADGLLTRERLEDVGLGMVADDLEKNRILGKQITPLSLKDIIKNPSGDDIGKSIKSKIQHRIEKYVMGKLEKDPIYFRNFFKKAGRKETRLH
ncbi:MAG: aldehyde ferredoxin oxidoreductase C-terminal domain-containing protein [Desulfobacterales bacterium]